MSVANLHCWVHGDDPDAIFLVEIATTKTVGALKQAIKEEKKHAFQDIDAKTLNLWKVFIPLNDDKFHHKLKKTSILPMSYCYGQDSNCRQSFWTNRRMTASVSLLLLSVSATPLSVFVMIPDLTSLSQKRGF